MAGKCARRFDAVLNENRIFESVNLIDSLEEDFISWKERFWPAVCEHFGLDTAAQDVR